MKQTGEASEIDHSSSSGMEMLYCVACGVYAHRSCAFHRTGVDVKQKECDGGPCMPLCQVNQPIVEAALGLTSKQQQFIQAEDSKTLTDSPTTKSSWSFFGRKARDDEKIEHDDKEAGTPENEPAPIEIGAKQYNIEITNEAADETAPISESTATNSSWSIFGRRTAEHKIDNDDGNQQYTNTNAADTKDHNHYMNSYPSSTTKPKSSWSLFTRSGDAKVDDENITVNPVDEGATNGVQSNQPDSPDSARSKSSWSLFGRTTQTNIDQNAKAATEKVVENNDLAIDEESYHPKTWCPHVAIPTPFGRKLTRSQIASDEANDTTAHYSSNQLELRPNEDDATIIDTTIADGANQVNKLSMDRAVSFEQDELSHAALENILTSEHDKTDKAESVEAATPPPPGAFRTSIEIIRKTTMTPANISKAYTVGMVAGGVAGLAIAGPAGVVVGANIGRTVLAVGAAVEGGVSVGVLVMSLVAAAKYTHKAKDHRELELPGPEACALVLVRPGVEIDPIWGQYAEEARTSWEKISKDSQQSSWGSGFGSLFVSDSNEQTTEIRYHRDVDIISADASELAMREKVFLLVNRILNDKMSLPGYMYRYLIRKCIVRSNADELSVEEEETAALLSSSHRNRRQDAHGVIKHVTATLLEVRKGLASSPGLTEMSAGAVEMLVFGDLYEGVFDEIIQQTREQHEIFLAKVEALHLKCESSMQETNEQSLISQPAISALKMLPGAHTPADKLYFSVHFLESVSTHFSTLFKDRCIDADALLKMVCQHIIIAANTINLHAEVAFIEEFSRDEQLLRGKEGYALITLQASLHYLDSMEELDNDLCPIESENH